MEKGTLHCMLNRDTAQTMPEQDLGQVCTASLSTSRGMLTSMDAHKLFTENCSFFPLLHSPTPEL